MRIFIQLILYILLATTILFLLAFGMDMEIARRDYVKATTEGNYDKPITGCLFEHVCKTYTQRLFNK